MAVPRRPPATSPAPSPAPTAVPTASPSPADWSGIAAAPLAPVADLTADKANSSGVALDTTFTLCSRTGTAAPTSLR